MTEFDSLTKFIPLLRNDRIGDWVTDLEHHGNVGRPIKRPFVNYSELVNGFINEVYRFLRNSPNYDITRYGAVLAANKLDSEEAIRRADVDTLGARPVLALILYAIRAEREKEGTLLAYIEDGSVVKWLERLKAIDEEAKAAI